MKVALVHPHCRFVYSIERRTIKPHTILLVFLYPNYRPDTHFNRFLICDWPVTD